MNLVVASFSGQNQTSCLHQSNLFLLPCLSNDHVLHSSSLKLKAFGVRRSRLVQCYSGNRPGNSTSASGENESRSALDAFFLGKAFAEALNERIESTVGEILSTVGRLQAEQQKQVQDFQEEVLERAKKAKEKAAREAMDAQTLAPKSTASAVNGVVTSTASPSTEIISATKSPSSPDPTLGHVDANTNPAQEE